MSKGLTKPSSNCTRRRCPSDTLVRFQRSSTSSSSTCARAARARAKRVKKVPRQVLWEFILVVGEGGTGALTSLETRAASTPTECEAISLDTSIAAYGTLCPT